MGTQRQGSSQDFNQTSSTTFAPPSAEEQGLRQQFSDLGQQQLAQLNRLTGIASNPYALSPETQSLIDTMQAGSQQQLDMANKQYADYLSGGRGLRMSDTPVAQQAIQQQALGQSNLLGQYANLRLNAGLQGNQLAANTGLGLSQAMPSGLQAAFTPLYNERIASGTTNTSGYGNMSGFTTQPLMTTLLQGLQGVGGLAQGVGTLGFGMGPSGMSLFGGK